MRKKSYQKDKTWEAFSIYIRLRDADKDGFCICISCRKMFHWEDMQAGHLIPSRSNNILFDEEIVYAQCPEDNLNQGEQALFWRNLKKLKGYDEEDFEKLKERKNIIRQYKQHELEALEEMYLRCIYAFLMYKNIVAYFDKNKKAIKNIKKKFKS